MSGYVRYQSPVANGREHHLGVFALVQGLARDGVLTAAQEAYRQTAHRWFDDAYPHPPAELFDRRAHPQAVCWFKLTAVDLLDRMPAYIETLLLPHQVPWERVTSDAPGLVLYEDEWQIVAG